MTIFSKQKNNAHSYEITTFFNYVCNTKPRNSKRNELVNFIYENFEITHNQDESVSDICILENSDPHKKDTLVIPYQMIADPKLSEKYEYIIQLTQAMSDYCEKTESENFGFEEIILQTQKAEAKHLCLLSRRENARAKNKLKRQMQEENEKRNSKIVFNNPPVKKKTISPSKSNFGDSFSEVTEREKKLQNQKNGSTFLSRLKEQRKNLLIHDFIQSKYEIVGNSNKTETWDITENSAKDQRNRLHLGPLLSSGNRFAIAEFKFVKNFTDAHENEISQFKEAANNKADNSYQRRPYI